MAEQPKVLLSAFADEAALDKTVDQQLSAIAALGLTHYSVRFVDVGGGVKNVMKLDRAERQRLVELNRRYDLAVATVGSPIGKVKLVDKPDGTNNAFVPFDQYLDGDVMHAIGLAHEFGTKLIRGFSFYPPKGEDPAPYLNQTVEQVGRIAERCRREGVVFGLELEANLVGSSGTVLAEIHRRVASPSLVTIYDGGNLACQNLSPHRCYDEYVAMRDSIGWMHVKDYRIDPSMVWHGHVDEERLKNFVPCDLGDSAYERVLRDFATALPAVAERMRSLGAPGIILDLEPHLKGGGQFGGFSGPDGLGVALRALQRTLDFVGIGYDLRGYSDLKR